MSEQNNSNPQDRQQESGNQGGGQGNILGSYISLITKAEVKYEGTLVEVDRPNKTMSLKNVKNMGTEGRRNGENEVPPSTTALGRVKFKVELIKTFNIIQKPPGEDDGENQVDPAIVSAEPENDENADQANDAQASSEESKKQQRKGGKRDDWSFGSTMAKKNDDGDESTPKGEGAPLSGDSRRDPRERQYPGANQAVPDKAKAKKLGELKENPNENLQKKLDPDDFDFNKHQMNRNDDEQENQENSEPTGDKAEKPKYDKKVDFFDQITNSTNEPKVHRGGNRGRGAGERGGYRGGGERGGYRGGGDRDHFHGGRGGYGGGYENSYGRGGRGGYYGGERGSFGGRGYRGGHRGSRPDTRGGRRELYSDSLRDPNDPNYNKEYRLDGQNGENKQNEEGKEERNSFYDTSRGGARGGRGGRNGYQQNNQQQMERRDAETFGAASSQNFKFNHEVNERGRGGRGGRGGPRGSRGRGRGHYDNSHHYGSGRGDHSSYYKNQGSNYRGGHQVEEDGHGDFYDTKKKQQPSRGGGRTKNRFAGLEHLEKKMRRAAIEDEQEEEEVASGGEQAQQTQEPSNPAETTSAVAKGE